jgi:hypothetical protein
MKKIAFWENCLCERGTTIAMYDYAYFNQTILQNQSIIIYNPNNQHNVNSVIDKFKKEFQIYELIDNHTIDDILLEFGVDILYIIKSGEIDGRLSRIVKTVVHCVFSCSEQHGQVYASVSPHVSNNNGLYPVVPHIVHLPNHNRDLREQLNIPIDAIVYGRHGGFGQFDIPYVQETVYHVAKDNPNIYFLFVNTATFCNPCPNIIHLDKIIDLDKKVEFINTCDAMLWARSDGETFGLAIAEFSIRNKPVFATHSGYDAHVHYLGDKGIWYNKDNLHSLLCEFNKQDAALKDWNAYRDFSPEKVMAIFKTIFIDN